MLRDHVAPALRAEGLRGSGARYSLPSESHWALVGFQSSVWNTSAEVQFTVNCKVVRRDAWEEARREFTFLRAKPSANSHAGSFEWTRRIGRLMPGGEDHWWTLSATDAPSLVAAEVVGVIATHCLPAMRAEIALTS